ncbi:MAG: hypothetical protein AB7I04_16170 [Pseudomonadales bacterium]
MDNTSVRANAPGIAPGQATLLTAPAPELDSLSFALAEPESVSEWISRLPMANVSETAGQIRQATFEIARLDTDFGSRMSLLEGIRPTVLYLAARLDKAANSAGNQADAISRLAQRLQMNLCSGYRAVVLAALPSVRNDDGTRQTLSLAVHRALTDLSRTLLRTLQYYVAPADRLWLKLNQLYHLAEQLGIERDVHPDTENNATVEISIAGVYARSLLLALARPYQLRHRQLSDVYRALGSWVSMVSLGSAAGKDLYAVDLASDQGPAHTQKFEGGGSRRALRSENLIRALDAYARGEADGSLPLPPGIDESIISHLADAWGEMKPRAFGRSKTNEPVKVTVGMRATHYFLSGGIDFADLLDSTGSTMPREINPFLKEDVRFVPQAGETRDVWEDAFDVGGRIPENPNISDADNLLYAHQPQARKRLDEQYVHHDTTSADMSPGGYRLRWNEPFPPSLQTGELIGLRDETDPRWCLAVARWIRQDDAGPFMGVELLSPQAKPVAVRLVQSKGGKNEYQRAFLLPELKPVGRPATLITPVSPYRSGQKVQLWDEGTQNTAQLGDCLLRTDSFNQFTFRVLDGYLEKQSRHHNMVNARKLNNKLTGLR